MKKILLMVVCCLMFCGCEEKISKSKYDNLKSKYNDLIDSTDTSKETAFLRDYIEKFNVETSEADGMKILIIYADVSKTVDPSGITKLIQEDWFENYDYVNFIGYGNGKFYGLTQIDVNSKKVVSSLEDTNEE